MAQGLKQMEEECKGGQNFFGSEAVQEGVCPNLDENCERLELAKKFVGEAPNFEDVLRRTSSNLQGFSLEQALKIPKGSIVCCRSLIQQTFDPEMYLKNIQAERRTGDGKVVFEYIPVKKFCDEMPNLPEGCSLCEISPKQMSQMMDERTTAYCVPIPGEWPSGIYDSFVCPTGNQAFKEALEMEEERGINVSWTKLLGRKTMNNFPIPWENEDAIGVDAVFYDIGKNNHDSKIQSASNNDDIGKEVEGIANSLSRMYGEQIKVNDVVEMIGIFEGTNGKVDESDNDKKSSEECCQSGNDKKSSETANECLQNVCNDDESDKQRCAVKARIHVVFHHVLRSQYDSLVRRLFQRTFVAPLQQIPVEGKEKFIIQRKKLLGSLQRLLHGDGLAAEYLLLTILASGGRGKKDEFNFTLNLYRAPEATPKAEPCGDATESCASPFVNRMTRLLSTFLPRVVCLPVSIDSLNALEHSPKWNLNDDIDSKCLLQSGLLQLAPETILLLDETLLKDGRLDSKGCKSLQTLRNVCASQQSLMCDFGNSELPLAIDVQPIVVSETPSVMRDQDSFIPLPLVVSSSDRKEAVVSGMDAATYKDGCGETIQACVSNTDNDSELLMDLRKYVATIKNNPLAVEVSKEMNEHIVKFFVKKRQKERQNSETGKVQKSKNENELPQTTPSQLRAWLALATALSASFLESSLTKEKWDYFVKMEEERWERLRRGKFSWKCLATNTTIAKD